MVKADQASFSIDRAELYHQIIESIISGIIVLDRQGIITTWNSTMEEYTGIKKEKAEGSHYSTLLPEMEKEVFEKALDLILSKNELYEIERYKALDFQKEIETVNIKCHPLLGKEKNAMGAVVVITDITDQERLEEQLIRTARIASLANLGASVAHEIRNPLNCIALNIQLLKEDMASPEVKNRDEMLECVNVVAGEIERLSSIVKDFLKFARPPEPKLESCDINEIVDHVMKFLKSEIGEKAIEIDMTFNTLPSISVDRKQIEQVIFNIGKNAIEAIPKGGSIHVITRPIRRYVQIEIKDSGPGLTEEQKQSLFDLFYTTKKDGTGLGLSIAERIIERHNGHIRVESAREEGTSFMVNLPKKSPGMK